MTDTIQQNVDALVVTLPRRVTLTDLFPGGLLSCFVFWDIAVRKEGYWFALATFALLALAVVYAHHAGEQLVFRAESIKHRIPVIGFHVTNQKFRGELVFNLRFDSRSRWGGLFRNDDGIAFTYKSRTYRFGNRLAREEADRIIRTISERYPQLVSADPQAAITSPGD